MLKTGQAEATSNDRGVGASPRQTADVASPLAIKEILVANSSIQFFDLGLGEAFAAGITHRYFECTSVEPDSDGPSLHQIELDETGVFRHPVSDEITDPALTYAIDGRKALSSFAETWIPIPFMRVVGPGTADAEYTEGPSNWARLFIHKDESEVAETRYNLVLAIDTSLDLDDGASRQTYHAPSHDDLNDETEFQFSADIEAVGWFVTEPWVDEWLSEAYRNNRAKLVIPGNPSETAESRTLGHLASYLTMLAVLAESKVIPTIQLAPLRQAADGTPAIAVDLLLDIGTSRTFAALAEQARDPESLHTFDALPIRNLTRPWTVTAGIFPSRLEFSKANFGSEVFSRWSGRTNAFYWPSIARIGHEAIALEAEPRNGDATTGISSPIRYLWDTRPARQLWRFAGSPGSQRRNGVVSDPMLALLTENGDLSTPRSAVATTKPRFSRSSLTTFFVGEVILQALSAINAPVHRWRHQRDGEPRRLNRIILTTPSSVEAAERAILRDRVKAAITLVWQAMGWSNDKPSQALPPPDVVVAGDVATGIQLAFLHNELGTKFRGDSAAYFNLTGRTRPGHGSSRSLRIATLDIGGGSSSIAVSTYALADTTTIVRKTIISEGFAVGAEQILKTLAERIVFPALESRLAECRLTEARDVLRGAGESEGPVRTGRQVELRRRLVVGIARPVAMALVKELEVLRSAAEDRPVIRTIGQLLATTPTQSQSVLDELESFASDLGADGFTASEAAIAFTISDIEATIKDVLASVIANAVRVIRALDCDVVLMAGWISRIPVVREMVLEGMPLRPDRILSMHDYRIGSWMPGRSALGNVDDSKSLPVIGAWLELVRQARVGGLILKSEPTDERTRHLTIGRLDPDGRIPDHAVLFSSLDKQGPQQSGIGRQATMTTELPLMLAVRRSPLPGWMALPMYAISLEVGTGEDIPRQPIRLTLSWTGDGATGIPPPTIIRATDADGIDLAQSEITLRLQTLPSSEGDWLDTGYIETR